MGLSVDEIRDNAAWERNARRRGDGYECIVCGAPVKPGRDGRAFWLHGGGGLLVTEREGERLNAQGQGSADLGTYPIGADCYRKHRALLEPYCMGRY